MKKHLTNRESSVIMLRQSKIWCSSQVVRPRSATPLSAGSNPACTSKRKRTLRVGVLFVFLGAQPQDLNSVSCALARRMPVHIPHSEIEELAFQAQSVGIFAVGEYPAKSNFTFPDPRGRFFILVELCHYIQTVG